MTCSLRPAKTHRIPVLLSVPQHKALAVGSLRCEAVPLNDWLAQSGERVGDGHAARVQAGRSAEYDGLGASERHSHPCGASSSAGEALRWTCELLCIFTASSHTDS